MEKVSFIYALVDPRTDEVRYVGKTVDLKRRMRRHRNIGRSENPSLYRDRWIQSLMDDGLDFIVWILEVCEKDLWISAEKKWISYFKNEGCKLTNLTAGGDGFHDFEWRPGQNRGSATPGRKKNPGFGEKVSAGRKKYIEENPHIIDVMRSNGKQNKGRKHTLETREKVSKTSKIRWQSKEHREKVFKAWEDPIVKKKMIEGGRKGGIKQKSETTRKRMSESAKKRQKFSCEFCGKELSKNNMVRHIRAYHSMIMA